MRGNHRDRAMPQLIYESKFILCRLNDNDIVEGKRAVALSPSKLLTSTTALL